MSQARRTRARSQTNLSLFATSSLGLVGSVIGGVIAKPLDADNIIELTVLGFVVAVVAAVLSLGSRHRQVP